MIKKTTRQAIKSKAASKAKFGSGVGFKKVSSSVASSEMKAHPGMSEKTAKRIGGAVAYKQGVKAHGKKAMTRVAKAGKARARA